MEFSRSQSQLMRDVIGWVALAAVMFLVARNYADLRRVAAEAAIGHPIGASSARAAKPADENVQTKAASAPVDGVEIRADQRGHFAARMEINGRDMNALVDTGASLVMLTYEDAQRAGVSLRDRDFTMQMQTANGVSKVAPVTLDRVAIGDILVRNVSAGVAEPGVLKSNLLGMTFLQKLQRFEIRSGTLVLQQ
jgi:aspartyl protease family protein